MAMYHCDSATVRAWAELPHAVATGTSAFRHAHGASTWDYFRANPEAAATFDGAMTANSKHEAAAVLGAYDFGRFETLVDVAGGAGLLLASILEKHERLRGVLFNLPHAIDHARAVLGASKRPPIGASSLRETPSKGSRPEPTPT